MKAQPHFEEPHKLGDIIADIAGDAKTLVKQEIELAKVEVASKFEEFKADAITKGEQLKVKGLKLAQEAIDSLIQHAIGAGLLALGGALLSIAAVFGLARLGLETWACYGVVGGVEVAVGLFLWFKRGSLIKEISHGNGN